MGIIVRIASFKIPAKALRTSSSLESQFPLSEAEVLLMAHDPHFNHQMIIPVLSSMALFYEGRSSLLELWRLCLFACKGLGHRSRRPEAEIQSRKLHFGHNVVAPIRSGVPRKKRLPTIIAPIIVIALPFLPFTWGLAVDAATMSGRVAYCPLLLPSQAQIAI